MYIIFKCSDTDKKENNNPFKTLFRQALTGDKYRNASGNVIFNLWFIVNNLEMSFSTLLYDV